MFRSKLVLLCFILSFIFCIDILAQDRFPKPEFEGNYQIPSPDMPVVKPKIEWYIEIIALFFLLAASSFFAIKKRSRVGILVVSIISLIILGFGKQGCICSVASIQNIVWAIANPNYIISFSILAAFILPLLFSLFFGRVFCGGVCPFGVIQDLLILRPKKIPLWVSTFLSMLPYFYLGISVLAAFTGSAFLICRYDPFVCLFRWGSDWQSLIWTGILLSISTIIARPYCRFLCPYSIILSWFSRFAWKSVSITPNHCEICHLCRNACPVDAIKFPSPKIDSKEAIVVIKKMSYLLLAAIPVILFCSWLAHFLAIPLSKIHPTVRLSYYFQSQKEEPSINDNQALQNKIEPDKKNIIKEESLNKNLVTCTSFEERAFRESKRPLAELYQEAASIQNLFYIGSYFLGAFLGVVFIGKLFYLIRFQGQISYEPDQSKCLSCMRCTVYCPKETQQTRINI